MDMWHHKTKFTSYEHKRAKLRSFLNFNNTVKLHEGIDNLILFEKLEAYSKE